MKKRVLSLLMASAMIVGLTACGSSNEPAATASTDSGNTAATTADNSGSAAAGNVSMTFTWWGNQTRNERTQAALDLYSEQNPGVTFDTQPAEWNDYWTKLSTLAAGNSLPECLQMDYSYLAQYVAADLLVDLTPYVEDGTLDVSNVSQGILDAGSIDGKLYAVCAGMNAPSLFYNKTLLDSLGITVKDNMTIDEFEAVAREVYEKSGVKTDLPYSAGDNYLPYAMRSHDVVKLFNEDSLNVTDAASLVPGFQIYEDGVKDGWIIGADVHAELTSNSVEQSPLVYFSSEATQSWCGFFWSNQLSAMVAAAPEGMEIGITTWPSENPQKSNFLKPSQFFSIAETSQNKEEAAKFLDWFTNSIECNNILMAERGIPVNSDVAEAIKPNVDENSQKVFDYIAEVSKIATPIDDPDPSGKGEIEAQAKTIVENLRYGDTDAAGAAEEFVTTSQKILSETAK